ncbi:MAG: hypothetical protein HGA37_11130 [Lentimicrobium sp.]|nr:hypothetical protein [Lentimicrobium sp.]
MIQSGVDEYPSVNGLQGGGNNVVDAYQVLSYPTVILIAHYRTILNNHIWLKQGIYIARINSTGKSVASIKFAVN